MSKIVPISFHAVFQFHYGTIKSQQDYYGTDYVTEFQFHYGTIKTGRAASARHCVRAFNSTMVRLKLLFLAGIKRPVRFFQFHYGTIKRGGEQRTRAWVPSFNSTMVRLKACILRSKRRTIYQVSIPLWYD